MDYNKKIKIVAFVGLPGSGKSTATKYITEKGYPKVYFGGVIYDAMEKANIPRTPDNEALFRVAVRKREGQDFAAKPIIKEIHDLINSGQYKIVVDGLYTWAEYKLMKHEFPGELTVVAVVAPKKIRHRRLAIRPKRPLTESQSTSRDWSEIEDIQKGGPIAIADHYIINDRNEDQLHTLVDKTLKEIGFLEN